MAAALDAALGTGKAHSSNTVSMTTTNAVASGSLIVLLSAGFVGGATANTPTSGGLTWNKTANSPVTSGSLKIYAFYAFAPSGLASGSTLSHTWTSGSLDLMCCAIAFTGIDSTGTIVGNNGSGATGTSWAPGNVTGLASTDALVAAAFEDGSSTATSTSTTEFCDFNDATQNEAMTGAYKLNPSATDTITGTWSTSVAHVRIIVGLKGTTSGTGATVNAPAADGTGDIPNPTVSAGSNRVAPAADGTGDIPAPTISASANVIAPPCDGTGDIPAPAIAAGSNILAPAADGTGDTPAPAISAGANITSPAADGTGDIPAPTVTAGGSSTVNAVPATSTGDLPTPTVSASSNITAVPADGTGDIPAPTVSASGNNTVSPPAADATGALRAPTLTWTANAQAAPAIALGRIIAPAVTGSTIPDLNPIHIVLTDPSTRAAYREASKATHQDSAHLVLREQP